MKLSNKILKTIILSFMLFIFNTAKSQYYLNREWVSNTGNPLALNWNNSITDNLNQIITVGNTITAGQGANILTTKFNTDGTINWQSSFNTANANNDYGVSLTQDLNGNIYVVGTTDNSTTANYDVVIIKYDVNGTLVWSNTFNASANANDIGTSIIVTPVGEVYVAASSQGATTGFDYLLIKYNQAGVYQWNNRYDFTSLDDVPIGVDFDAANNIFITGASASSTNNWDYAIARFDNAGNFIGDERNPLPGIGFDQPMAFKKDAIGNIYITGKSSVDGINYNVKTIKINAAYILQWTQIIDYNSKEDVGNAIDVDANSNIYVGGYITNANNKKEVLIIKYDSNGNLLWQQHEYATNATGDASIKALSVRPNGDVYFVDEEKGLNNTIDAVVTHLDKAGNMLWQKKIASNSDDKPTTINISNDGSIYVSTIQDGTIDNYQIVKYTETTVDTSIVYNTNGKPMYKAHELLVSFQQSAINKNAIDNTIGTKEAVFGGLDYFLNRYALDKINFALAPFCTNNANSSSNNPCGIKAYKVHTQLKTTDTNTINRLGDVIQIPDFWTTLLLEFPATMQLDKVYKAIDTLDDVVRFSEPNYIVSTASVPNDTFYIHQTNLHYYPLNWQFAKGNINIEPAWDIVPSGGKHYIRCGIFDTGIDWKQKEFGYDGIDPNSSNITDGWDLLVNANLKVVAQPDAYGHGTNVAGIIAARRNDSIGIAGIAGGNDSIHNKGISIYSLRIITPFFGNSLAYIKDAITESIIDTNGKFDLNKFKYRYGLHIANNSWRYDESAIATFDSSNNQIMKDAVHQANRTNVTFCAARGDEGKDNLAYPAIIDSDWVLCVGGTGSDGCWSHAQSFGGNSDNTTSYGHNVDIGAPAFNLMCHTVKTGGGLTTFNATSAATPHVAGVVGLLMSYLNDSIPAYKNLAPEDCEQIIKRTAKDDDCIKGFDDKIGAGLLDAGAALQLVQKPNHAVTHFGTNPQSKSIYTTSYKKVDSNKVIRLVEPYNINSTTYYKPKKYKVNIYKVDCNVKHQLGNYTKIDTLWARPSSSTLLENVRGDSLLPRERIKVNFYDQATCNMSGFIYQVFDNTTNTLLGWWPFDTSQIKKLAKFEYTVLAQQGPTIITNIGKLTNNFISISPNPATNEQTIKISLQNNATVIIKLYNIQGQYLKTIYTNNCNTGNVVVKTNISDLIDGLYFYNVQINNENNNLKFLKQ